MTVAELIGKLMDYPADMEVFTIVENHGCDIDQDVILTRVHVKGERCFEGLGRCEPTDPAARSALTIGWK